MTTKKRVVYPPLSVPLYSFMKSYLYQSTFVGTALTVALFPAYLQLVSFMQKSYALSDQALFTLLLSLSHIAVYVIVNGTFTFLPLKTYRFSRNAAQVAKPELIRDTLIAAIVSQVLTSPLLTYFLFPAFKAFGLQAMSAPLPSRTDLAFTYFVAHCFNEFGFYLSHRLLHHPKLYFLHKQHHEYKGSIGIAAEYAHPIETLVSNILPSIGGVVFFGCHHPICIVVWLSLRLYQTYCAHGGLALKGTMLDKIGLSHIESAAHHDHHHTVNKGCFGSLVTDYLFSTMDDYVEGGLSAGYIAKHCSDMKSE